jgi:hypothetical protein
MNRSADIGSDNEKDAFEEDDLRDEPPRARGQPMLLVSLCLGNPSFFDLRRKNGMEALFR